MQTVSCLFSEKNYFVKIEFCKIQAIFTSKEMFCTKISIE